MCLLLGYNNRILRTAYYRHGACVICIHVLGRIHEFSCHCVGQADKQKRDDTELEKTGKASIGRVPTPEKMLVKANNR